MAVEDLLLIVLAAGLVLFGGLFAVMREKDRKVRTECTMLKEQLKQSCRMEEWPAARLMILITCLPASAARRSV